RHEDHGGDKFSERRVAHLPVAAHEQPYQPALQYLADAYGHVEQFIDAALKNFVARMHFENARDLVVFVTVGDIAGARNHGFNLAAQHRDLLRRHRVGARREQTHEAVFADDAAMRIRHADADKIRINAPMHTHPLSRFRKAEIVFAGAVARRHQLLFTGDRWTGAQQAAPGIGFQFDALFRCRLVAGMPDQQLLTAEKCEIADQHPVDEGENFRAHAWLDRRLPDLRGRLTEDIL